MVDTKGTPTIYLVWTSSWAEILLLIPHISHQLSSINRLRLTFLEFYFYFPLEGCIWSNIAGSFDGGWTLEYYEQLNAWFYLHFSVTKPGVKNYFQRTSCLFILLLLPEKGSWRGTLYRTLQSVVLAGCKCFLQVPRIPLVRCQLVRLLMVSIM